MWSILQANRKTSILQRKIVFRLEGTLPIGLNPIERWSDENYAPQPLDFIWHKTQDIYRIVAPTHGFEPHNVYVDLCRGYVMVLLSAGYDQASRGQRAYCGEIQIPAGAKRNRALVEMRGDFLTITLHKKESNRFIRLAAEIARLGTDYGLPYAKVQQLQQLEDIELH
jgi:hypothetical protein